MNEAIKLHGSMRAVLIKSNGETVTVKQDNAIMSVGFDFIADSLCSASSRPDVLKYIAVGTGSGSVLTSQTSLGNQLAIQEAVYSHARNSKQFSISAAFGAGQAVGTITEAAVFNRNNGIMFDRVVFQGVTKGREDVLNVTFTFTLS